MSGTASDPRPAALGPASPVATASATAAGLGAVALWATLAALTVTAGPVPPFQLTAMAFAVATLVGLVYAKVRGQPLAVLVHVPPGAWALGVYGLLGYHVCYFAAFQLAPALDASLINYLWPLLIVVLAGFLPRDLGGSPLRWQSLLGAAVAFAGTALVLLQGKARAATSDAVLAYGTGYGLALAAAVIWSSYSVASRHYRDVPSTAVTGFCGLAALGAGLIHGCVETWVWPETQWQWLAIAAMGLGPVGLAFYLWDEGMKHGDIVRLGLASYVTPVLSTLVLASFGLGTVTPTLALAALLVTAGAVIAGQAAPPKP